MSSTGIGGSCCCSASASTYVSGVINRFLAHSISAASSRRGRNRWGGGNALASGVISLALWSRTLGQARSAGLLPQAAELVQRSGVEGPGFDALAPERAQTFSELPGRLLREGDRQDLTRLEGATRDLPCD